MSSDYKIRISESRAAALRAQADELDITINTLMAQIIEGETSGPQVPTPANPDTAAIYFLDQLEYEHRKLIEDCCKETKMHPASYILSYIKLAHDQGNTSKTLPEALDPTTRIEPVALSNKTCEWCHTLLEDRNARFCPPPAEGESCGRQASMAALRASRNKPSNTDGLPKPKITERHIKV